MNIAEIILLLSAIFSASAAYVFYREARRYKELYENLEAVYNNNINLVSAHDQMDTDPKPEFGINYIEYADDNIYHGMCLAVVRRSSFGKYRSEVVIKVFADEDEDYNQRCAEELLEKLTERTTTDN